MGLAAPAASGRRGRLPRRGHGPARVRRQRQDAARLRPLHRRRRRLRRDPVARRDGRRRGRPWLGWVHRLVGRRTRTATGPRTGGRLRATPAPAGPLRSDEGADPHCLVPAADPPGAPAAGSRRHPHRRTPPRLVRARRHVPGRGGVPPLPRGACRSGRPRTARSSTTAGSPAPGYARTAASTRPGCVRRSPCPCCSSTGPQDPRCSPTATTPPRRSRLPPPRTPRPAGHFPHEETPDLFNSMLVNWLATVR